VQKESALHYWEQTLRDAGNLDSAPFKASLELWREGNCAAAEPLMRDVLAQEPRAPLAQTFLGIALYYAGRAEEALLWFEKALAIEERNAVAHYFAGLIIGKTGIISDNARAREHHRAVADIHPDWIDNLVALGQFCYFTGAADEAVQSLRRAIELQPDNAEAHRLLVEALAWLGEHENLEHRVREAAKVVPSFHADLQDMESENVRQKRSVKHARYPDQQALENDFVATVKKAVLADLATVNPFITNGTKFFTLGSCFAGNLAAALLKAGYLAFNLRIGEAINTTYANRAIFEWLADRADADIEKRMGELLAEVTKNALIEEMRKADVLIYTVFLIAKPDDSFCRGPRS
jgi:tetratricopeptide (TPR) repeat protein